MVDRPSDLQYANSERPPALSTAVLAVQHSAIVLINLLYVVIITKSLNISVSAEFAVISTTLLVCGIGSILQAKYGSGLLVLFHPNPIYLMLVIMAGQLSGLVGIATLAVSAGLTQFLFGSAVRRLRVFFPPEVCGIVVIMLGVSLLPGTLRGIVTVPSDSGQSFVDNTGLLIAIVTLSVASACSVWLSGTSRFFSLLLGCLAGLLVAFAISPSYFSADMGNYSQQIFALPSIDLPGLQFDSGLILVAIIGALVNVVDELGVLVGTERLDDADWRKPDFNRITRGLQASGLLTAASGVLGGVPVGMSSANLSLAYASGVTSRIVASAAGLILVVAAFLPFLLSIVLSIPNAVLAGILFYSSAYFIVSGAELALSRMMSPRRALVIGISVAAGVILQSVPVLSAQAKGTMWEHILSPMTFATILAIGLNLFMRIGIKQKEILNINRHDSGVGLNERLHIVGERWGLHRATVARTSTVMTEILETVAALADGPVACTIEHDELNLYITLRYQGMQMSMPDRAPTPDELISDPHGIEKMSAWIIKRLSDGVTFSSSGSDQVVRLVFEC